MMQVGFDLPGGQLVENLVAERQITVRGARVHNLKELDIDLPHRRLIVFCGVSGSGKTSLALDTLYAEGQRRYIESFSAYTRQFLERLEKPDADRIDGIPPAIAVTRSRPSQSGRSTVGTATETTDYLRLLYAKIGQAHCPGCGRPVRRDSPQSTAAAFCDLPDGTRILLCYPLELAAGDTAEQLAQLREEGFIRVVLGGRMYNLADFKAIPEGVASFSGTAYVVTDRLTAGRSAEDRLRDSLETAFQRGRGTCSLFAAESDALPGPWRQAAVEQIDGRPWRQGSFTRNLRCAACGIDLPDPEPRLFSFNSPLGACPRCEGFGTVTDIDMELVVPNPNKTLRQGAIAPWTTPAYEHELHELLALAADYDIPVDVPYRDLTDRQKQRIHEGVPERGFGGLQGFFRWLERHKYKMPVRVFLSRLRSRHRCPECQGKRLRPAALATRIGEHSIADLCQLKITDALAALSGLQLGDWETAIARSLLEQILTRLRYLASAGLGYLTLDRRLRTLSGGECQRVALTTALGSNLVNMLYVLDEPSVGLHPQDVDRLLQAILALRDRGNTVLVVEHEEAIIRNSDQVVEIGPAAGERGGDLVFQGSPEQMLADQQSVTGAFLSGRRGIDLTSNRRPTQRGWLKLQEARGHNLQEVSVDFPLGVLCLVTGVSGAGKSTLVQETLYPALARRLGKDAPKPLPHESLLGEGQLDDVVLVDQSPIGRSPRSNPVTYIKAFDAIRQVFADTLEARTNNFTAGHFSFNVDGGRCSHCQGDGHIQIDMQFLADVYMKCPQCHGQRYRREILAIRHRGLNIAEVLQLTVREAFGFFRGRSKVQAKLKRLMDVGLDYLRLGQGANTLSGGEAQRLKLASFMTGSSRNRTLFLLDEPTTGLHFADIVQLLDCFDSLLAVGHSLIVVEHNLQLMEAADYIIDVGPGAADEGGRIVRTGTPEAIAGQEDSATGRFLRDALSKVATTLK